MYIKNIYDEWKLHNDATQLEINYNFLVKFIDILDVEVLCTTKNEENIYVDSKETVRKWKMFQMTKLLSQFTEISNCVFDEVKWFNDSRIFVKSIFIVGFILNSLKNTNYKASELNSLYEPKLFLYAEEYLDLEVLEEWISMLSKRIFSHTKIDATNVRVFDWTLTTDRKYFINTTWYLENLLMNFNDITTWFNKLNENKKLFANKKPCIINIVNHMIVYSLTDFYAKYYTEVTGDKYLKIYQQILNQIAIDINNYTFAINSFKQISSFLNLLLNKKIIMSNDVMIRYFTNFIGICCSEKNVVILKEILLKIDNNLQDEIFNDSKTDSHEDIKEEIPNHKTNPIELDSFENYKIYKTTLLEASDISDDEIEDKTPKKSTHSTKYYKNNVIDKEIESIDAMFIDENYTKNDYQENNNSMHDLTKPLQGFNNKFTNSTKKINDNSVNKHNTEQNIENDSVQEEADEYE